MRLKNTVDIMVIKTITIEDLKTQKFHKEMKMLMMGKFLLLSKIFSLR